MRITKIVIAQVMTWAVRRAAVVQRSADRTLDLSVTLDWLDLGHGFLGQVSVGDEVGHLPDHWYCIGPRHFTVAVSATNHVLGKGYALLAAASALSGFVSSRERAVPDRVQRE